MGDYDFNTDIKHGEDGEKDVINNLISMGAKFISDNKDYRYDVIMEINGKHVSYEIKTDIYCFPEMTKTLPNGMEIVIPSNDTGNIFIETECRGKNSGINVTEADWFVYHYKFHKEIWYIKTDKLKDLIKNNDFKLTEQSGDVGSGTRGYLIPRNEHKEHFIIKHL